MNTVLGMVPMTSKEQYLTPEQWQALGAVAEAIAHQNKKWGRQNHSPEHWYVILGEEVGEVGKEVFNLRVRPESDPHKRVMHSQAYRDELAQVAAVAADALAAHYRW